MVGSSFPAGGDSFPRGFWFTPVFSTDSQEWSTRLSDNYRNFHTYRLARQSARAQARQSARDGRDKVPVDNSMFSQANSQANALQAFVRLAKPQDRDVT